MRIPAFNHKRRLLGSRLVTIQKTLRIPAMLRAVRGRPGAAASGSGILTVAACGFGIGAAQSSRLKASPGPRDAVVLVRSELFHLVRPM